MTGVPVVYQPKEKRRVAMAFGAALLIHFAALALANVQRADKPGMPAVMDDFSDITFEETPSTVDPTPENPDPLPTPPSTIESFPEERSTPPPIHRPISKRITPIVKPRNPGLPSSATWSSAKVLAVNAPRPEYPYEARRQKITGEGSVLMTVDPVTGHVSTVSMARSTGSPVLDNAALSGFRRWRFKPGTVSSVTCPITFTLVGASY